jgi:hypothetical protein
MSASPIFFDKRLVDKVDAIIVPLTPTNWSYNDDNNISDSLFFCLPISDFRSL